ncbi:unnamed protein product [Rotaria socialis]|uniref:Uncharacterized protein n=1 Tax=Rotaria socialis TaxID=392032 RepID=A0A820ZJP3_9BILA|nr:unnamed protein product [Rotaria socialis]
MKIKWLDLESSSMKHILCGADYPDLYGLSLYNIKEETAGCLFIDERLSSGIFKNPITTLIITAGPNQNDLTIMKSICHHIFIVFIKLTHFIFYESSYQNIVRLLFDFPSPSFYSSTLEQYRGQCHVYSYPFLMQYYDDITNNIPGGLYRCVRVVSLYDEHPFENEFFIRIAQSFPFMEELSLINRHSQNHKTI